MLQSKALKDYYGKKRSKLYLWWIQSKIGDCYYDFMHNFIQNPIYQAKRLYEWYVNVFRFDHDFDGQSLFAIIEYKLKRVEKALLNGNAIHEPKDLKAIKLAIKLASRLKDDRYEESFYNRHDKKWGETKTWFEPCNDGSGNSYWRSSKSNADTPEKKEEERRDILALYDASYAKMQRESHWFYDILHKYLRNFWD